MKYSVDREDDETERAKREWDTAHVYGSGCVEKEIAGE